MPGIFLFGGSRATVTPGELGCTAFDVNTASTYSLATAKANAQLLQEYADNIVTRGKALIFPPGRSYAVADHDEDDYDIYWSGMSGLQVHMAGRTHRQVPADNAASWPTFAESVLVHVDDGSATHYTFDGSTTELTTSAASTTVTVVGETVASTDVGAMVRITGGTNFLVDFYEITDFDLGDNTWTLDRVCTTGAGDAGAGWMRTRKSVVGLADFTDCELTLNIRGSNDTAGATADTNLTGGVTAFDGLRILNDTNTAPSGQSYFNVSATQCQTAVDVDFITTGAGPDVLEFGYIWCRKCRRGLYVNSDQSVDIVVNRAWNGGTTMDSLLDFSRGGAFTGRSVYAPFGRVLRIRNTVNSGAGDFKIESLRVDDEVKSGVTIVDCEATSSPIDIEIRGSMSNADDHQFIKIARLRDGDGNGTDCQVRIKRLGTEGCSYPMRRHSLDEVPIYVTTDNFASTVFRFDPTDSANLTTASGVVETVADDSAQSNDVTQSTAADRPALAELSINRHTALRFDAGDYLIDTSPTGMGTIGDVMVMAVVVPETLTGTSSNVIVALQDTDGTDGICLDVLVTSGVYNARFQAGPSASARATSTVALKDNQTYLLIGRRNSTTGVVSIQVEGVVSDVTAATGNLAAVNGDLIVGCRQASSSTVTNAWDGLIGPIFIDLDYWEDEDDEWEERINYFRGNFGVWE